MISNEPLAGYVMPWGMGCYVSARRLCVMQGNCQSLSRAETDTGVMTAHLGLCMGLQGSQSSSTIAKVLANIVAHPAEAKYRKLRLANKRIQETIVDVDGGVELLQVYLSSNL